MFGQEVLTPAALLTSRPAVALYLLGALFYLSLVYPPEWRVKPSASEAIRRASIASGVARYALDDDDDRAAVTKMVEFGLVPEVRQKSIVWIVARHRTGSSMIAQAISADEQSRLWLFEPAQFVESLLLKGVVEPNEYDEWLAKLIADFLQCRIRERWYSLIANVPQAQLLQRDVHIVKLFRTKPSLTAAERTRRIEELCRSKRHLVVKTVRADLGVVERVVQALPAETRRRLRIVHLWRDPRGSALSVGKVFHHIVRDKSIAFRQWLPDYCRSLETDWRRSEELLAAADDDAGDQNDVTAAAARYERLLYERFVDAPTAGLKRLLRFGEMQFTEQHRRYLARHFNVTASSGVAKQDVRTYSTVRGAEFDPLHWRREMNASVRELFDGRDCAAIVTLYEAELQMQVLSARSDEAIERLGVRFRMHGDDDDE